MGYVANMRSRSLAILGSLLLLLAGCRSPGITVQIANQTEGAIHGVEVLYPGGSYGIGHLLRGGSHAKWIKPNADGVLHIAFLDEGGHRHAIDKVNVKLGHGGGLAIVLLPKEELRVEDHTGSGRDH